VLCLVALKPHRVPLSTRRQAWRIERCFVRFLFTHAQAVACWQCVCTSGAVPQAACVRQQGFGSFGVLCGLCFVRVGHYSSRAAQRQPGRYIILRLPSNAKEVLIFDSALVELERRHGTKCVLGRDRGFMMLSCCLPAGIVVHVFRLTRAVTCCCCLFV
jgi:hypothetical protein